MLDAGAVELRIRKPFVLHWAAACLHERIHDSRDALAGTRGPCAPHVPAGWSGRRDGNAPRRFQGRPDRMARNGRFAVAAELALGVVVLVVEWYYLAVPPAFGKSAFFPRFSQKDGGRRPSR